MQDQVKERLGVLQREINFRENEIAKLNSDIDKKQAESSAAAVSSQVNGQRKNELEQIVMTKDITIKKLQADLDETRRQLD